MIRYLEKIQLYLADSTDVYRLYLMKPINNLIRNDAQETGLPLLNYIIINFVYLTAFLYQNITSVSI